MNLRLDHFNGCGKVLAKNVGVHAAFKILESYGGQRVWISSNPKPTHSTSIKLGFEAHQVLSKQWPEQELELPVLSKVLLGLRRDEIVRDSGHLSMREMVIKYGITRSAIQKIVNNHDLPPEEETDTSTQSQLKLAGF